MNQKEEEIELGVLRDGYPALADWIARDPDNETFVFRKFDRLAARNILHLQAQLTALEREIEQLDETARHSPESNVRQSLRRYETLINRANDAANPGSPESRLITKLKELKELLKDYHEAICRQSQINGMNRPRERPLSAFREFVDGSAFKDEDGSPMPIISGRAKAFLNNPDDLVALTKPEEDDYLSRFLQDHWLFRKRRTADPLDRTTIYKNAYIVRTVAAFDLVLAAVLLIGAIIHLYFVTDPKAKLGLVAMYTILFASSMLLCTNARRAEIFAATATYAAVLVVFEKKEFAIPWDRDSVGQELQDLRRPGANSASSSDPNDKMMKLLPGNDVDINEGNDIARGAMHSMRQ
ncbi:uncharacterized protein K460DRAFT_399873 [Cucurbitaria berberidis CBS 394.84]|uniref:DUF6594 domain-containing protein n=1 Tax=Cucurbitaria berberidis CBS 394.84 TaxID=1168544 RepID=A0A9P4GRH2_9PLEO|nr:uncharacterized protein K460DRAFT_399873 [Cucurbitaria berberidis CBS 394.84]KAF1849761.1 hypothetical protein K460DRAFT_399873 [Cucurbitaria berberidis CBS 394.84]